jgi:anhydro-N-acetylmuramic acid kinase
VKNKPDSYNALGLMSGTSLDGVDLAYCNFTFQDGRWNYAILFAETLAYTTEWRSRLAGIENGSAYELTACDIEYGSLLGKLAKDFIRRHDLTPDFIASHGHTIFHRPSLGITLQIGRGSVIAAETSIPVICDFRSSDVALGGQGAPLVPAGDRLLFHEFDYCLNLGGFANISFEKGSERIAFDVCPVNIVLNRLSQANGKEYDENGSMARDGILNPALFESLNSLPFYSTPPPKSLGKEWVLEECLPIIMRAGAPVHDALHTFVKHIAFQVSRALPLPGNRKLLITGGGAFNAFLVEQIIGMTGLPVIIPDPVTVNFKEALIFAFLGVLRLRGESNCLSSVTGAREDNTGGAVYTVPE